MRRCAGFHAHKAGFQGFAKPMTSEQRSGERAREIGRRLGLARSHDPGQSETGGDQWPLDEENGMPAKRELTMRHLLRSMSDEGECCSC